MFEFLVFLVFQDMMIHEYGYSFIHLDSRMMNVTNPATEIDFAPLLITGDNRITAVRFNHSEGDQFAR
ncbi:hypothetical protein D3C83_253050 [compost metagenome]